MEFNWSRESITVTESDRESDESIVALKSGNSDGAKALWLMFFLPLHQGYPLGIHPQYGRSSTRNSPLSIGYGSSLLPKVSELRRKLADKAKRDYSQRPFKSSEGMSRYSLIELGVIRQATRENLR
ncbi:MAG: hypothetical protein LBC74_03500 [Planctomycetaceae bacterium]|jgi:hypothetical protein|nr:hypothetical protein [Planctomycetaceae bacterium]